MNFFTRIAQFIDVSLYSKCSILLAKAKIASPIEFVSRFLSQHVFYRLYLPKTFVNGISYKQHATDLKILARWTCLGSRGRYRTSIERRKFSCTDRNWTRTIPYVYDIISCMSLQLHPLVRYYVL